MQRKSTSGTRTKSLKKKTHKKLNKSNITTKSLVKHAEYIRNLKHLAWKRLRKMNIYRSKKVQELRQLIVSRLELREKHKKSVEHQLKFRRRVFYKKCLKDWRRVLKRQTTALARKRQESKRYNNKLKRLVGRLKRRQQHRKFYKNYRKSLKELYKKWKKYEKEQERRSKEQQFAERWLILQKDKNMGALSKLLKNKITNVEGNMKQIKLYMSNLRMPMPTLQMRKRSRKVEIPIATEAIIQMLMKQMQQVEDVDKPRLKLWRQRSRQLQKHRAEQQGFIQQFLDEIKKHEQQEKKAKMWKLRKPGMSELIPTLTKKTKDIQSNESNDTGKTIYKVPTREERLSRERESLKRTKKKQRKQKGKIILATVDSDKSIDEAYRKLARLIASRQTVIGAHPDKYADFKTTTFKIPYSRPDSNVQHGIHKKKMIIKKRRRHHWSQNELLRRLLGFPINIGRSMKNYKERVRKKRKRIPTQRVSIIKDETTKAAQLGVYKQTKLIRTRKTKARHKKSSKIDRLLTNSKMKILRQPHKLLQKDNRRRKIGSTDVDNNKKNDKVLQSSKRSGGSKRKKLDRKQSLIDTQSLDTTITPVVGKVFRDRILKVSGDHYSLNGLYIEKTSPEKSRITKSISEELLLPSREKQEEITANQQEESTRDTEPINTANIATQKDNETDIDIEPIRLIRRTRRRTKTKRPKKVTSEPAIRRPSDIGSVQSMPRSLRLKRSLMKRTSNASSNKSERVHYSYCSNVSADSSLSKDARKTYLRKAVMHEAKKIFKKSQPIGSSLGKLKFLQQKLLTGEDVKTTPPFKSFDNTKKYYDRTRITVRLSSEMPESSIVSFQNGKLYKLEDLKKVTNSTPLPESTYVEKLKDMLTHLNKYDEYVDESEVEVSLVEKKVLAHGNDAAYEKAIERKILEEWEEEMRGKFYQKGRYLSKSNNTDFKKQIVKTQNMLKLLTSGKTKLNDTETKLLQEYRKSPDFYNQLMHSYYAKLLQIAKADDENLLQKNLMKIQPGSRLSKYGRDIYPVTRSSETSGTLSGTASDLHSFDPESIRRIKESWETYFNERSADNMLWKLKNDKKKKGVAGKAFNAKRKKFIKSLLIDGIKRTKKKKRNIFVDLYKSPRRTARQKLISKLYGSQIVGDGAIRNLQLTKCNVDVCLAKDLKKSTKNEKSHIRLCKINKEIANNIKIRNLCRKCSVCGENVTDTTTTTSLSLMPGKILRRYKLLRKPVN